MHKAENHVNIESYETFSHQFPKSNKFTSASFIYRYSHSDTGPLEILVNRQDTSNKILKANQRKFYFADISFCVLRLSAKDTGNITGIFKDV